MNYWMVEIRDSIPNPLRFSFSRGGPWRFNNGYGRDVDTMIFEANRVHVWHPMDVEILRAFVDLHVLLDFLHEEI